MKSLLMVFLTKLIGIWQKELMIFTNTDQIITINQKNPATIKILNDEDFYTSVLKLWSIKMIYELVH